MSISASSAGTVTVSGSAVALASFTPVIVAIGRLHWVLDVSMDEDRARNRKGNGAVCLGVIGGWR